MKGLSMLAALVALAGCSPAGSTTWHVDYAAGRDSADGRTPATAWKHAPGDAAAGGGPAGVKLQPGDTVLFRAGVPYRGAIRLTASGTAEKPIVYTGIGWGEGLGVIDGSEPVSGVQPCSSAADCGGAPEWKALTRVEYAAPQTQRIILFGAKGSYWPSQYPILEDPFYADEIERYEETSVAQVPDLEAGRLVNAELAKVAADGGKLELAIWSRPNHVFRVPVLGVEGDTLRFPPETIKFYADRPGRVALMGSFAGLAAEGRFAVIDPGVMVVRLRPEDSAGTLSIGNGRMGISINGQSNVQFRGLHFRNFTGQQGQVQMGQALANFRNGASNILVRGNLFGPSWMDRTGSGLVMPMQINGLQFLSNRIENAAVGHGLVLGGRGAANARVEGNVVRRTGRSGIYMLGVDGGEVRGNIVTDIQGRHGNAITAYLNNRNVVIEGNCVVNARRPITFHATRSPELRNDLVIRGNILIANPDGQGAINAWGRQMQGVSITRNLAVGPKHGILLNGRDADVRVVGNDTSGIAINGERPEGWVIEDNLETLSIAQAVKGEFSETGCSAPVGRLKLSVSRTDPVESGVNP